MFTGPLSRRAGPLPHRDGPRAGGTPRIAALSSRNHLADRIRHWISRGSPFPAAFIPNSPRAAVQNGGNPSRGMTADGWGTPSGRKLDHIHQNRSVIRLDR
ncbi:hypothetical protein GCM10027452_05260 [Micromonospora halotolerans]